MVCCEGILRLLSRYQDEKPFHILRSHTVACFTSGSGSVILGATSNDRVFIGAQFIVPGGTTRTFSVQSGRNELRPCEEEISCLSENDAMIRAELNCL